jgi:hypothetical protein
MQRYLTLQSLKAQQARLVIQALRGLQVILVLRVPREILAQRELRVR